MLWRNVPNESDQKWQGSNTFHSKSRSRSAQKRFRKSRHQTPVENAAKTHDDGPAVVSDCSCDSNTQKEKPETKTVCGATINAHIPINAQREISAILRRYENESAANPNLGIIPGVQCEIETGTPISADEQTQGALVCTALFSGYTLLSASGTVWQATFQAFFEDISEDQWRVFSDIIAQSKSVEFDFSAYFQAKIREETGQACSITRTALTRLCDHIRPTEPQKIAEKLANGLRSVEELADVLSET